MGTKWEQEPLAAIQAAHVVSTLFQANLQRVALVECVEDHLIPEQEALILFDVQCRNPPDHEGTEAPKMFHSTNYKFRDAHEDECLKPRWEHVST